MSKATSDQQPGRATPSRFAHADDGYSTPPSQVDDVYFSAEELLDDSNHGFSNFDDEEQFNSELFANECLQSPRFDECHRPSEYDENWIAYKHQLESLTGALPSANPSNLFQPGETSSMDTSSTVDPLPIGVGIPSPQANQSPSIQANQIPSIQADQQWTCPNKDVLSRFQLITCLSTSDSQMCMLQNEGSAIANEHDATYYNEEQYTKTSANFLGGHASLSTHITGVISSDEGEEMSLDNPSSPYIEPDTPMDQQNPQQFSPKANTRSRGAKGCDNYVQFLLMNGNLASDDGYEWRKYGQKTIKETIHPRAYYKCARPGCLVKKQVENSSDVEGAVLVTYINRHNHPQ